MHTKTSFFSLISNLLARAIVSKYFARIMLLRSCCNRNIHGLVHIYQQRAHYCERTLAYRLRLRSSQVPSKTRASNHCNTIIKRFFYYLEVRVVGYSLGNISRKLRKKQEKSIET